MTEIENWTICIYLQSQYKFLYHVLHEAFRGKGQFLSKDNFIREVDSQTVPNKAVNLSRFRKEFMVSKLNIKPKSVHRYLLTNYLVIVFTLLQLIFSVVLILKSLHFQELNSIKPVFGENEKKFGRQHLNLNTTSSVLPCKLVILHF